MPHRSLLDPAELKADTWAVLDARADEAYRAGHWPGAIYVPVAAWEAAARQADTGLDNTDHWHGLIGELGIDGTRSVAVYDDGRLTEAARVWFVLQHFGVPAAVVDGGWPLLSAQPDLTVETSPAKPMAPSFLGGIGAEQVGLVTREDVRGRLSSDTRIFDARTAAEFAGEELRRNARGGHLPGARRVGHADLIGPDGRLKASNEIRMMLSEAGFKPGDRIITHCDGGGRAALAALAAVEAGFPKVDAYYLSFSDWAKDESCPIIKGDA
ncbi:sulfurtransferase [Methylobacterium sp. CM6247]